MFIALYSRVISILVLWQVVISGLFLRVPSGFSVMPTGNDWHRHVKLIGDEVVKQNMVNVPLRIVDNVVQTNLN